MNKQESSATISKEANKELMIYKAEQELTNKSEAVIVAISKARKYDQIKYKDQ